MRNQTIFSPAVGKDDSAIVFCAIELSRSSWVVALYTRVAGKVSVHKLRAGDVAGLLTRLGRARGQVERALGRPGQVVSCYEAGFDGFWLHRELVAAGIDSRVMNPASLLVDRRARRAKSDRIDVRSLLRAAIAHWHGDRQACRMVRVPSVAQEDARRLHRERQRLIRERVQHSNRIKSLLALHGIDSFNPLRRDAAARLAALRTRRGEPLPPRLAAEIGRELDRLALVVTQIKAVEAERNAVLKAAAPADDAAAKIQQLARLKSIGPEFSTGLVREVFYRSFANRRELGSYVGFTPTPFRSGCMVREQGISKAGNPRARTAMIELAWMWTRRQPDSALTQWFHARVNGATGRVKRIAIVALARKLLVALWRYLETGLIPEGAILKDAPRAAA